jgi:hypothetical protein
MAPPDVEEVPVTFATERLQMIDSRMDKGKRNIRVPFYP